MAFKGVLRSQASKHMHTSSKRSPCTPSSAIQNGQIRGTSGLFHILILPHRHSMLNRLFTNPYPLFALHPRGTPALHCTHSAFGDFCPHILFLNVRRFLMYPPACLIDYSFNRLPKDTLPMRETAVATTASILGGFGVVALFCSAGVYV